MRRVLLLAAGYLAITPVLLFAMTRDLLGIDVSPVAITWMVLIVGLAGLVFYTGQVPGTTIAKENPHWIWKPDKVSNGQVYLSLLVGAAGALAWRYFALEFKLLPRGEAVAYSYCVMFSLTMLTAGLLLKDRTDAA